MLDFVLDFVLAQVVALSAIRFLQAIHCTRDKKDPYLRAENLTKKISI